AKRESVPATNACHVLGSHPISLWVCPVGHGTILLSARSQSLSRHDLFRGTRETFPWLRHRKQELPIFPSIRHHARDRSPCTEFARYSTPRAGRSAGSRAGRKQSTSGSGRIAG